MQNGKLGIGLGLLSGSRVKVTIMTRARVGVRVKFYLAVVLCNFFRNFTHCAGAEWEWR